jgi:hypothetical protein
LEQDAGTRKRRRPDIENEINDIYADPTLDPEEIPTMPKRTRRPRTVPAVEEAVYFGGDEANEDSDNDAEEEAEVEGHRQRFRNQRCRRRDRLVKSIKDALLPQNYRPIDPPTVEALLKVKMTKDPVTNTPASEVTWTNMEPNRNTRSAAENTTYKGRKL